MKSLVLIVLLVLCSLATAAALPEILPYGIDDLPVPPSPRKNNNDPKVVDLLGAQLNNPDPLQRARLLAEIAACELPNGAKYAKQAVADSDWMVRAQAARAAGTSGDKSLIDDLKKLATDTDPRVRAAAMQAAAPLGGDAVIAIGLGDKDPSVVLAAVESALPANADAVVVAMNGASPAVKLSAVRTLGRLAAVRHADALAPLLKSESVALRSAAAEALGQMKSTAHAAAVDALLADKHPTVRRSALTAIASLMPAADLQKRAITALADPDLSVRENAANLLAKQPTPDAIDALADNLGSESERLHLAARTALVAIGQSAVPRSEQMLTDADPRRREDASYILGRLKSDAGLDKHIALLSDKDWKVIRQAADSLGRIGRKEAVPELVRIANMATTNPETFPQDSLEAVYGAIERAIVSCAYFDEHSILPVCRKVLPDKMHVATTIRAAAAYAAGRMDDPKGPVPNMINRILGDQEDAGDVKTEGLKALGHLKAPIARNWVGTTTEDAKFQGGGTVSDWISYWVRWKISGKEEPFEPTPELWEAPVSIRLIPE
jgi:HEAT repeat protein